jgi:hypothetical protein
VGLCIQKMVLEAWHEAAFVHGQGVYESWDSDTFMPDEQDGAPLRDRRDDVAYGAAIARYHGSAQRYGDNELTEMLDEDLKKLVPIVQGKFAQLPSEYDGQLYFDLRAMAGGLRMLNELQLAAPLDALAEAYGRAIYESHYQEVTEAYDAGADGGEEPEAGEDAADGGEVVSGQGVIGAWNGEQAAYEPASAASAAVVLLDLAQRHAGTEEPVEKWQRAAVRAANHLWLRAREPSTGMVYRSMLRAGSVDEPSGPEPRDAMLLDVQATVALSMLRAHEMIEANAGAFSLAGSWPWLANAEALLEAVNAVPGMWDAGRGGYSEGWVPSTAQLMTDKTTRGNGRMLSAVHRAAVMGSSPYAGQMTALRAMLMQRMPAHTSLLSARDGQVGYFLRVPADFDLDSEQGAAARYRSYFSRANGWGCEALDDGWFGKPR